MKNTAEKSFSETHKKNRVNFERKYHIRGQFYRHRSTPWQAGSSTLFREEARSVIHNKTPAEAFLPSWRQLSDSCTNRWRPKERSVMFTAAVIHSSDHSWATTSTRLERVQHKVVSIPTHPRWTQNIILQSSKQKFIKLILHSFMYATLCYQSDLWILKKWDKNPSEMYLEPVFLWAHFRSTWILALLCMHRSLLLTVPVDACIGGVLTHNESKKMCC